MEALLRYPWSGNARELKNVIERAMIVSSDETLAVSVPRGISCESADGLTLEDVERRHIMDVLKKCGWRFSGPEGAAVILGLKRTTLQSKMKKLGIQRPSA
jgi:transcriptional regulator of acetoin/glycerol metabolism